jgi:hypothetical protein
VKVKEQRGYSFHEISTHAPASADEGAEQIEKTAEQLFRTLAGQHPTFQGRVLSLCSSIWLKSHRMSGDELARLVELHVEQIKAQVEQWPTPPFRDIIKAVASEPSIGPPSGGLKVGRGRHGEMRLAGLPDQGGGSKNTDCV